MLLNPFSLPKLFQKVLQKKHGGFGHSIMAGEMYAKVVYLQKSVERKKTVKSQKPKRYQPILIHTYEIFATNI